MTAMRPCLFLIGVAVLGCSRDSEPKPAAAPVQPASVQPPAPPDPVEPPPKSPPPKPSADVKWTSLLAGLDVKKSAVAGNWSLGADGLHVAAAPAARIALGPAPRGDYDIRIEFTRRSGTDSIGTFFPHGSGQGAFETDGWCEHLAGVQNVLGRSFRDNETRVPDVLLQNGRRYSMTVQERAELIRCLLDDRVLVSLRTTGSDLTVPDLWAMPDRTLLGVGAWKSETTFHAIEVRGGSPAVAGANPMPPKPPTFTPPLPPPPPPPLPKSDAKGKRVLLVIANRDFFYREYGDPRAEMEKAGIKVTVAAGTKTACTPHNGSGEGADRGVVQPDLALKDAKAADYDAILFSGGWGSSAYQFAFPGRYDNAVYNGDKAVKAEANRLVGEFIEQEKPTCALCNAVSVLAWARVGGKSPLQGKRVCAPPRQAAAGIYNNVRAQPSCRWHPEQNGAILSPAGSVGNPGTAADDVMVDGLIVTGEDDISAREMGRRIVQLLSRER